MERQLDRRATGARQAYRFDRHVDALRLHHAGHDRDPQRGQGRQGLLNLTPRIDAGAPHDHDPRIRGGKAEQHGILTVFEDVTHGASAERPAEQQPQSGAHEPRLEGRAGPYQPEARDGLHPAGYPRQHGRHAGQHDQPHRDEMDDGGPLAA